MCRFFVFEQKTKTYIVAVISSINTHSDIDGYIYIYIPCVYIYGFTSPFYWIGLKKTQSDPPVKKTASNVWDL